MGAAATKTDEYGDWVEEARASVRRLAVTDGKEARIQMVFLDRHCCTKIRVRRDMGTAGIAVPDRARAWFRSIAVGRRVVRVLLVGSTRMEE